MINIINEETEDGFNLDDLAEMQEIFLEMEDKNLFIIQQISE